MDPTNTCGEQWIDYIDYCFTDAGIRNERCEDVFSGIGEGDWVSIMPAGYECYTVEERCFEPDAYDYYGTDVDCIAQWKAFDDWCWNNPNHDDHQCTAVNEAYEEEMESRRLLVLLADTTTAAPKGEAGFSTGFGLGAGLAVAAVAIFAVKKY